MARATKRTETVKLVVTEEKEVGVTLELSTEEAEWLRAILGAHGEDISSGIFQSLYELGVRRDFHGQVQSPCKYNY